MDIHLSNDEFFAKLAELFDARRENGHGSIYLVQKRLTYSSDSEPAAKKVADDPLWDLNPPNPLPVLIRATDGKSKPSREDKNKANKVKLSTVVQPDALEAFYIRYADVCKTGMSSLKKRDRKKDKAKKKKKKTGAEGEKKA